MAGIKDYSTTQSSNTDLNGISTAEGMLPSNLNNAIRALMKNTRDWYNDSEWVQYGDGSGAATVAYASGTTFTIAGIDLRTIYIVGRRIKVIAATPGTIYGTISAVAFSTNTTVTVVWDSGSLSSETIDVYLAALTTKSIPKAIDATRIGGGDVSTTEFNYLNGVTSDLQTQLDAKNATITGSATTIDTESLTANRAVISNGSQKIAVSDVTSTELSYLDGVSSNVQTQLNAKNATITGAATTIDTEDLTASRALTSNGSGKVEVSAVTSTELGYLDGVSSAIQTQLDAKQASDADLTAIGALAKTDSNLIVGNGSTWVAESGATARTSLGLGSIATQAANNVSISGGSVTGLGEPSNNSDASTKSYVDQAIAGLRTRTIAECASTANVNISNALEAGDAIDGITLVAGDRVLLKNQSTDTENGLYLAVANGAGAASRDPEHDSIAELSGGMVVVNQGSVNDNKIFLCTTNNTGSVGSTAITYTVVTPSNSGTVTSIVAGTGLSGGTITSAGTIAIDTGTTVDKTTAQTLTNKTLTSPIVATPTISGSASSAGAIAFKEDTDNGTNSVTLKGAAATDDVTVTLPAATDTLIGKATTDTLTNKTFDLGGTGNSLTGSLSEFNTALQSDSFAGLAATQTLTNKTLTSPKINEDVAVTSTATELNLLDGVSGLVQADLTKLAAIDATAAEIDTLDALSRGSIIYGNASAATAILTKGGAGTVLTSDGTDLSWGAVDAGIEWQTIVTGSTLTAVAGRGYWINTTSNTCTITLPSSASAGDEIKFSDYARTWGTNKIIIDSNGLKYQGETDSFTVEYNISGQSLNIIYSGAAKGWIPFLDKEVANAPTISQAIFAYGYTGSRVSMSNILSGLGVIAADVTGVGSARSDLTGTSYGGDKGIIGYGRTGSSFSLTNLVSNIGVISADVTGVGSARFQLAACTFGTGEAIFAYGNTGGVVSMSNKVSTSGVVATDVTGVGTARQHLSATGFGDDKGIFIYGNNGGTQYQISNLVSSSGVIASDTSVSGTAKIGSAAAVYGGDKAIVGFGTATGTITSTTNLISNSGVVASDTTGVGTARHSLAAASYGGDKAVFAYGDTADGGWSSLKNLISNSGVVASDVAGVGTARASLAATGFGG